MDAANKIDWKQVVGKILICGALFYAILVTAFCPCKPILWCHISAFYISVGIAVAVALFFNGKHCFG